MNEQDLLLIERYYRNELTDAERLAFEQRMAADPAFQAEALLHSKAMYAIRLQGRESLKKKWRERPTAEPGNSFPWVWSSIAFFLVALIAGWWWYRSTGNVSSGQPTPTPSQTPQSAPTQPAQPADSIAPPPPASQKPIAKRPADPDKLFASAFKPYKDESLNPNVRAEGEPGPFEQFQQLYWDGKHPEALAAFEKISPALKNSDNVLFIKANSLLATGKTNEASSMLEKIIANKRSRYLAEARWYLALAYLKSGEMQQAKDVLRQVASDSTSSRRYEAERLSGQLR